MPPTSSGPKAQDPRQIPTIHHGQDVHAELILRALARLPEPGCNRPSERNDRLAHIVYVVLVRVTRVTRIRVQVTRRQGALNIGGVQRAHESAVLAAEAVDQEADGEQDVALDGLTVDREADSCRSR